LNLRLSHLAAAAQPITEIAASLGFATPNYASRCFKKFVSTSPKNISKPIS